MEDDHLNSAGVFDAETAPAAETLQFPFGGSTSPEPPKRSGKKWMRITAVAVLVVAVLGAAAALAVPAVIRAANPKAYVAASLARTLGDFSADSAAILSDTARGPFRADFSLEMSLTPSDPLSGKYGLEAVAPQMVWSTALECDAPGRRADLSLDLTLAGRHIATALLQADGARLTFGSPQLTGGAYYYVNTETLGADMAASPVFGQNSTLDPDYGFNLFDAPAESSALDPATTALLRQFAEALNKEITVEKAGSPTVTVLGRETNCAEYVMTVPADALRVCVSQSLRALYEDEAFSAVPTDPEEFLSNIDDLLSTVQDSAVLRFYIAMDRVVFLETELSMEANGKRLTGRFTSEFDGSGGAMLWNFSIMESDAYSLTASFSYQDGGQFTFSLDLPGGDGLTARGRFTANRAAKTVALDIPELTITADSAATVLDAHFSIGPMSGFTNTLPIDPASLMELDEDGLYGLALQAMFVVYGLLGGDMGSS